MKREKHPLWFVRWQDASHPRGEWQAVENAENGPVETWTIGFLICKGLEYRSDIAEHLIPGAGFPLSPPSTEIFWGLYWVMTGIHAIHLTIGIIVVLVVMTLFGRGIIPVQGSTVEGVAIYWHFVDTVWIFLFPLLYLTGRS